MCHRLAPGAIPAIVVQTAGGRLELHPLENATAAERSYIAKIALVQRFRTISGKDLH